MPIVIDCPKCKTKYKLSDEVLGRALKCKSCSTVFKIQPKRQSGSSAASPVDVSSPAVGASQPVAGSRAPTRPVEQLQLAKQPQPTQQPRPPAQTGLSAQPRSTGPSDFANFDLNVPVPPQADFFPAVASTPTQRPDPPGELAADRGFFIADKSAERNANEIGASNFSPAHDVNEQSEVAENPYMTPMIAVPPKKGGKKAGSVGSAKKGRVSREEYRVPRIGMWMILGGLIYSFVAGGLFAFFRLVGTISPNVVNSIGEGGIRLVGLLAILALVGYLFSGLAVLVGQFLCIFSPQKDEKTYASFSLGSLAVLVLAFIVAAIVVGTVGAYGGRQSQAVAAGVGLGAIALGLLTLVLGLAYLFCFIQYFKKVGQNLRAHSLVKASSLAFYCWLGSIAVTIFSAIVVGIITGSTVDYQSAGGLEAARNMSNMINLVSLFNTFVGVGATAAMTFMVWTGVRETKS